MLGPRREIGVESSGNNRERASSLATDALPNAVEEQRRHTAVTIREEALPVRTSYCEEHQTGGTYTLEISFLVRSTAPPNEKDRIARGRLSLPDVEVNVKPSHSASKKLSMMDEMAKERGRTSVLSWWRLRRTHACVKDA